MGNSSYDTQPSPTSASPSPFASALVQSARMLQVPITPDLTGGMGAPVKSKARVWPKIVTRRRPSCGSQDRPSPPPLQTRSLPSSPSDAVPHAPILIHPRPCPCQKDGGARNRSNTVHSERPTHAARFQSETELLSEQIDNLAETNRFLQAKLREARTVACDLLTDRTDTIAKLTKLNETMERNRQLEEMIMRMDMELGRIQSAVRGEFNVRSVPAWGLEEERIRRLRKDVRALA